MKISIRHCMALLACLLATGCSRLAEEDDSHADAAHVAVASQVQGVTPFIVNLVLRLDEFTHLDSVSKTIAPKPALALRDRRRCPYSITNIRAPGARSHSTARRSTFPTSR